MPVPCKFCELGTNGDHDKKEYPVCKRVFLAPEEVADLLDYNEDKSVHTIRAYPNGMLIGIDSPLGDIVELCANGIHIELADPKGHARSMKHGISIAVNRDPQDNLFLGTNEEALQAFEKEYCCGE